MTNDVIDAEIVDESGTAIEVRETDARMVLFGTNEAAGVLDRATAIANTLAPVIENKKLFSTISGRRHVRVEGWQTLGAMLGVFAVETHSATITDDRGKTGWEARVEVRTLGGNVIGAADAQCTRSESTWSNRDDFAIRSMAQTRATSKALRGPLGFIVELAGFSATPAEELSSDAEDEEPGHPCPNCGGPVWDNTGDPEREAKRRPAFSCKDKKKCKWATWNVDEFEPGEGGEPVPETQPGAEATPEPETRTEADSLPAWLADLQWKHPKKVVLEVANAWREDLKPDSEPFGSVEDIGKRVGSATAIKQITERLGE